MPKNFEQINDFLFTDTSQIIANMCVIKRRSLVNTGDISPEIT